MKNSFILYFIMLIGNFSFAQSNDILAIAEEKVTALNNLLVMINADAALTTKQQEKIKLLHTKRISDTQSIRKDNTLSKEEKELKIKDLRAETGRIIYKDILTIPQRQAKKKGAVTEK